MSERSDAARSRRAATALAAAIDETAELGRDALVAIARHSKRIEQREHVAVGHVAALPFVFVAWWQARRDTERANAALTAFRDALTRLGPPPGTTLGLELPVEPGELAGLARGIKAQFVAGAEVQGARIRANAAEIRVKAALERLAEARELLATA